MGLGRLPLSALVLLAPVPPTGMLWSSMRLALEAPALWARTALGAAEAGFATTSATRQALFTDEDSEELVHETHINLRPQPVRPLLEAQWPRCIPRAHRLRVPVLTLAAEHDRLIPVDAVRRTATHHGAQHVTVAGAAHAMMLDASWIDSAQAIHRWLQAQPEEAA
jgi:pimeloyl-ACP methyl ester carboxylesterase